MWRKRAKAKVYSGDEPYVFVSYAHADVAVVNPIIEALCEAGYRIWYDVGIKLGTYWPDNLARRIDACECVLALVTRASVKSKYCKHEIYRAFEKNKKILVVYLEEASLDSGLGFELDPLQATYFTWYKSDKQFIDNLLALEPLKPCMVDRPKETDKSHKSHKSINRSAYGIARQDSSRDARNTVERPRQSMPTIQRIRKAMVARNALLVASAITAYYRVSHPWVTGAPWVTMIAVLLLIVAICISRKRVNVGLSDYSWAELKIIADKIARAGSDAIGLKIARNYGLVDADGRLLGDAKAITLADGTRARVRIAGFRYDVRADGGGKAGITFEFSDVPAERRMNAEESNYGGWKESDLRSWLNHEFLALLPDDLRSNIVEVNKQVNNRNATLVAGARDKLWLLSMPEVFGTVYTADPKTRWSTAAVRADDLQYKLYADWGVSIGGNGVCKKAGMRMGWWLRTTRPGKPGLYYGVISNGDWSYSVSVYQWGVSPGFCF